MTEDERTASIVAQVLDQHEQREAIEQARVRQEEAAAEQDRLELAGRQKRRRTWIKGLGVAATVVAAVVGGVVSYGDRRAEAAATETKETRRRLDVDTSIRVLQVDVQANTMAIEAVGDALEDHVTDQRTIDGAEIRRASRQEAMLERLVRDRGLRGETKTKADKAAEAAARKAAGLPVDPEPAGP